MQTSCMGMYPNKNVNLSQFYSVPAQAYSSHGYPYSLYIQPNHSMNIVSPTQQNTPGSASGFDDFFPNGGASPSGLGPLGATNGTNFQGNVN